MFELLSTRSGPNPEVEEFILDNVNPVWSMGGLFLEDSLVRGRLRETCVDTPGSGTSAPAPGV